MFINVHIFLLVKPLNIKFVSIYEYTMMWIIEEETGIETTISEFTARKINIEMVVGDNKFDAVH